MFRRKDKVKDDDRTKTEKSKRPTLESKVKEEKSKSTNDSGAGAAAKKSNGDNRSIGGSRSGTNSGDSGESQLTVALRVRPLHPAEAQKGAFTVVKKVDNKMIVLMDPQSYKSDILRAKRSNEKQFVFDCSFDGAATQEEVYTKTTKSLIENVLNGYNGTVFAYGATGAGKTHTMVGADTNPGTMVRALNDLFGHIENTKQHSKYSVTMSYMEIYNEMIRDLLQPSSGYLELRENSKGAHKVVGLSTVPISNAKEVMQLLMKGNKQRTQEPTAANQTSSRSHALLQVTIKKEDRIHDVNSAVKTGQLFMVDLAGSERAAQTQNSGKRLKEGAHINRSLLALGNCINALASKKGVNYVNFRDSKLTRLLKEPLSGNCRTVMIAHVSPASIHYDESRNTLLYADRAKNIKNKIHSNISNVHFHVTQYKQIITELKQEIQRLQDKLETEPAKQSKGAKQNKPTAITSEEMKVFKEQFMIYFKKQMTMRQQMMELDNTMLALSTEFDKLTIIIDQLEAEKAQRQSNASDAKNSKDKKKDKKKKRKENDQDDEDIKAAYEEIHYIQSEQSKYLQVREDVQQQFESCRDEIYRLEEELPQKISNGEQREILVLFCKVHELEIQKMEIQTETLIRQYELKKKELMICRYDRQREISEEIITKQRAFIDDLTDSESTKHLQRKAELIKLYTVYKQELEELNNGRDSPASINKRAQSTMSLKPGANGSILDLSKAPSRRGSMEKLPVLLDQDRPGQRLRSNSIISVRSQIGGSLPTSPLASQDLLSKLPPIGDAVNGINTPPNRNGINGSVRNISALAARRKSLNINEDDVSNPSKKEARRKSNQKTGKRRKEKDKAAAPDSDTFSIIDENNRKSNKPKNNATRKGDAKKTGMRRSSSTTTLKKKYRPASTASRDIDQMLSFSLMR